MMKKLWLATLFAAVVSVIAAPAVWSAERHLEMGTYVSKSSNAINNGKVETTNATISSVPYETTFYYLAGMEKNVDKVSIGLTAEEKGQGASINYLHDVWYAKAGGVGLTIEDNVIKDPTQTTSGTGFIITLPRVILGGLKSDAGIRITLEHHNNSGTCLGNPRDLIVYPKAISFSSDTPGYSSTGEVTTVNFYPAEIKPFDMQVQGFDLGGLSFESGSNPADNIKIGLMDENGKITREVIDGEIINNSGTAGIKVGYVDKDLKLTAADDGFGPAGKFTLAVYSTIEPKIAAPTGTDTKPATVAGIPIGGVGQFIFKKIEITVHQASDVPPSQEFGGPDGKVESAIENAIDEINQDPDSERAKDLQEMLDRIVSDDKTPNYIVFGGGDEKGESTFEFVNGYPDYFRRGIDVQDQDKKDTEFTFVVLKPGEGGPVVNTTFAGPINVEIWYETELTNGDEGSWIMKDPFIVPFDDGVGRFTFSAAELIEIVKERYPDYFETRNSFTGHVRMTCDVWPKTDKGQPEGVREFYFKIVDSSVQLPHRGGGSCAAGAGAAAVLLAAALVWRRKRSR